MAGMTIKDIAKKCHVGVSTVSRAMNNHPDINPETKEKILKAIEEANYVPNNSARNLKRNDAKAIAVLVKGIGNTFFSELVGILERECEKKGYSCILQYVDEQKDEWDVAIRVGKEKRLRGLVFLGGSFSQSQEKISQMEIPCVLSTICTVGMPGASLASVSVDDFKESYKMTEYLIGLGHKKIAFITAPKNDASIGKLRLMGYRTALEQYQIPYRKNWCVTWMKKGTHTLISPVTADAGAFEKRNITAVYARQIHWRSELQGIEGGGNICSRGVFCGGI